MWSAGPQKPVETSCHPSLEFTLGSAQLPRWFLACLWILLLRQPLGMSSAFRELRVCPFFPLFPLPLELELEFTRAPEFLTLAQLVPHLVTALVTCTEGWQWSANGPNTSPLRIFKNRVPEAKLHSRQSLLVGYFLFTLPDLCSAILEVVGSD